MCPAMNGLRIKQHDYACSIICTKIKAKFEANLAPPKYKDLHPAEDLRRADIYIPSVPQAIDYTYVDNLKAAYTNKIKKYNGVYDKPIIPFVIDHQADVHILSLNSISRFCNL
jgi:hypothetical protein